MDALRESEGLEGTLKGAVELDFLRLRAALEGVALVDFGGRGLEPGQGAGGEVSRDACAVVWCVVVSLSDSASASSS